MRKEQTKQEILERIKRIVAETAEVPGQIKFASLTGIKEHVWRGRFWRGWSEALTEAGFAPKEWFVGYDESHVLEKVADLSAKLRRFPSQVDLRLEANSNTNFPSVTAIKRRWNMEELALAVATYCDGVGRQTEGDLARSYAASRPAAKIKDDDNAAVGTALGYVYMQRHDTDFKIGFTKSLNKRGRQIQIELPKEIELVHSILTDDPPGVESYWHRRFAGKRIRGEWFKLTKAYVAAFKKWSKIW